MDMHMCEVSNDGDSFYICVSLAVFRRQGEHVKVREMLWDYFCRLLFGCQVKGLQQMQDASVEIQMQEEAFQDVVIAEASNRGAGRKELVFYVLQNAKPKCVPDIRVVSILASRVFNVNMVVFIETERVVFRSLKKTDKCIHIVDQGNGIFHMLIPDDPHAPVVTNFLIDMDAETLGKKFAPIQQRTYELRVYDCKKRLNQHITYLREPKPPHVIHYSDRLDMRFSEDHWEYTLKRAKTQTKIYIFTRQGDSAILVCYWEPDYVDPVFYLEKNDECIYVVPANTEEMAREALTRERHIVHVNQRQIQFL
jgi:hypothetical protein